MQAKTHMDNLGLFLSILIKSFFVEGKEIPLQFKCFWNLMYCWYLFGFFTRLWNIAASILNNRHLWSLARLSMLNRDFVLLLRYFGNLVKQHPNDKGWCCISIKSRWWNLWNVNPLPFSSQFEIKLINFIFLSVRGSEILSSKTREKLFVQKNFL